MKKSVYLFVIALLVVILACVSFFVIDVHVPYFQYRYQLDQTRNAICEKNNYEYMDYFYEYRGRETLYVLKVKIDKKPAYVAYRKDLTLVDTYYGEPANINSVKKAIEARYKDQNMIVGQIDVGYEDGRFVYYTKHQTDTTVWYIYYDLKDGDFVKMVKLGEDKYG